MANDGEIVGILERDGVEVRHRELRCVGHQFAIGEETLAGPVENASVLSFAGIRTHLPAGRCGRNKHFTRCCARAAQRQPGARDAAASACSVVIKLGIGRRLLYLDMFPIQAEFFRQDHGKSGHDALAHFRLAENERHAIVGRDAHPGVEGVRGLLFLLFGLIGKSARRKMEADD